MTHIFTYGLIWHKADLSLKCLKDYSSRVCKLCFCSVNNLVKMKNLFFIHFSVCCIFGIGGRVLYNPSEPWAPSVAKTNLNSASVAQDYLWTYPPASTSQALRLEACVITPDKMWHLRTVVRISLSCLFQSNTGVIIVSVRQSWS